MLRKRISKALIICLLFSLLPQAFVIAEQGALAFRDLPEIFRPGKTVHISFVSPREGQASLTLEHPDGSAAATLQENVGAAEGSNSFFWNGFGDDGVPLQQGSYRLRLKLDDVSAEQDILVGGLSPQLNSLRISDPRIESDKDWYISALVNMPGTLSLSLLMADGQALELLSAQVPQGELRIPWDGRIGGALVDPGRRSLALSLTDETGFSSNPYRLVVEIPAEPAASPEPEPEPAPETVPLIAAPLPEGGHYKVPSLEQVAQDNQGSDYWSLPVGEWDEAKIWEIMMQPMTVLEGRDQRETYKLRLEPDKSTKRANIVGEITYVSQGVHVLETLDNGWTLVETFNSSYGPNNRTRRGYGDTDAIIKGYVETSVLQQKTPREDYGILIDKLKQELYVFKDGKLFTTLIISTGLPTKQQPWNETPAGEYLMVSRVGTFNAGNLVCRMAMRINGGALIHEVPYILNQNTGHWDYTIQERVLGEKASHGCIRVQRKNNEDGINMTWLWNNIKVNTKVLVWDDTNRYHEYPADDLALYYNPDRGQYYHANQNCPSVRDVFLPLKGELTYAELDSGEYARLTPCRACNPPERRSKIDALNLANGF